MLFLAFDCLAARISSFVLCIAIPNQLSALLYRESDVSIFAFDFCSSLVVFFFFYFKFDGLIGFASKS